MTNREILAYILVAIATLIMGTVFIISFVSWDINWVRIRGIILATVLYLIAYFVSTDTKSHSQD